MTTNVYDGQVGFVATDSRWSVSFGRWLCYLDETNFDKLEVYKDTVIMFAGQGWLIQEWKKWIRSDPTDDSNQPPVKGISINGFDMSSRKVKYSEGLSITHENSVFAGSGAIHAVVCWKANGDAVKSVETAKSMDPATGGDVKYIDFSTRKSNLTVMNAFWPGTIEDIDKQLAIKGKYMDMTTRQNGPPFAPSPTAASQIADDDADLKMLKDKIASGQLSASAPCSAMHSDWSPEATSQLKSFLGDMFGWKK